MFENTPQPKDMFDGLDETRAQQTPPATPSPSPQVTITPPPSALPPSSTPFANAARAQDLPPAPASVHQFGAGKVVLIIVVALLVMGASGFAAYKLMIEPSKGGVVDAVSDELETDGKGLAEEDEETIVEDEEESTDEKVVDKAEEDEDEITEEEDEKDEESPAALLDSDGDGLTNAQEVEAGTSVTMADTDSDGLGDREEVEVYDTDPRAVDTDGDTYLDGAEVSNGYNPNGPGRLFSVPTDDEAAGS